MTGLPTFQPNMQPTAAQMATLVCRQAFKAGDTARALTTTLTADPDLSVAVDASATYEVSMHVMYTQGTLGQLFMGFTGPAGATFDWGLIGLAVGTTASDTGSFTASACTIGTTKAVGGNISPANFVRVEGRLVVDVTSGSLTYRWAQSASNATGVTVKAGSYMIARQIA